MCYWAASHIDNGYKEKKKMLTYQPKMDNMAVI